MALGLTLPPPHLMLNLCNERQLHCDIGRYAIVDVADHIFAIAMPSLTKTKKDLPAVGWFEMLLAVSDHRRLSAIVGMDAVYVPLWSRSFIRNPVLADR